MPATPSNRAADRRLTVVIYVVIALLSLAALWPLIESERLADSGRQAAGRGDYAAALAAWQPLAEQGNADAQFNVGVLLDRGMGAPEDPAAAAAWYRRAADQGNAAAQVNLGLMYLLGRGVGSDDAAAVEWFRRAAEGNVPEGLVNLGYLYRIGRGVPRDPARAYGLLRRGALFGNTLAALGVAEMLARGEGVDADPVEALGWAVFVASGPGEQATQADRLAADLASGMDRAARDEAAAWANELEKRLRR